MFLFFFFKGEREREEKKVKLFLHGDTASLYAKGNECCREQKVKVGQGRMGGQGRAVGVARALGQAVGGVRECTGWWGTSFQGSAV